MVSIFIQSTGQAFSHCRQPIQSSISTCNRDLIWLYSLKSNPIFLSGWGHFSFGYCSVATRFFLFLKCLRVKPRPVKKDFIPYTILLKSIPSNLSSLIFHGSPLVGIRIPEHFFQIEIV